MSDQDHWDGETLPAEQSAGEQPSPHSACSRPRRLGLVSRTEKAQARSSLFGQPPEPIKVGRFELREYVGGGGMGEVYEAYDERLDRNVAIKVVRADRAASPQADER